MNTSTSQRYISAQTPVNHLQMQKTQTEVPQQKAPKRKTLRLNLQAPVRSKYEDNTSWIPEVGSKNHQDQLSLSTPSLHIESQTKVSNQNLITEPVADANVGQEASANQPTQQKAPTEETQANNKNETQQIKESFLNTLTQLEEEFCVPNGQKKATKRTAIKIDADDGSLTKSQIAQFLDYVTLIAASHEMLETKNVQDLYNIQGKIESILNDQWHSQTEALMVMLHASPNILIDEDLGRQSFALSMIDFRSEVSNLKRVIVEAGCKMNFKSRVATRTSFAKTIQDSPQILHISCHGTEENKQHLLIFENEFGGGEKIYLSQLQILIENINKSIKLVVINACNSQKIGELFQKQRVEHIVCIKNSREVLDTVAIQFTQNFYESIFMGKPVCEAFQSALPTTQFARGVMEHEVNLFCLLRGSDFNDAWTKKQSHECQRLLLAGQGQMQCISEHNLVKQIPVKTKLSFRERALSQIMETFLNVDNYKQKIRILSLSGLQGIGKSSLARSALHYAAERKLFLGGYLFVKCKEISIFQTFLKEILRVIFNTIEVSSSERQKLFIELCAEDQLKEYLKDFFKGKQKELLKKRDKHCSERKEKNLFILCLDNIDQMVENDENGNFTSFLNELCDDCTNLVILVTSAESLNRLQIQTPYEVQYVGSLKNNQAAELFYNLCQRRPLIEYDIMEQPFDVKDIIEWILKDVQYPYHKMLTLEQERSFLKEIKCTKDISSEQKEQLTALIMRKFTSSGNNKRVWIQWMSHHDMFTHIAGNPTSIMMISATCRNEELDLGSNRLIFLYEHILENKEIIIDRIGNIGYTHDQKTQDRGKKPNFQQHKISFQISTEMSIKLLKKNEKEGHHDDVQILYFLGCLPGGIKESQLKKMLDRPVEESLMKLEALSFIENNEKRYILTPQMFSYIENQHDQQLQVKLSYMETICNFYKSILHENFKVIDRKEMKGQNIFNEPKKSSFKSSGSQSFFLTKDNYNLSKDFLLNQINALKHHERKTVIEKMLEELCNIEYCLKCLIEFTHKNSELKEAKAKSPDHQPIKVEETLKIFNNDEKNQDKPILQNKLSKIAEKRHSEASSKVESINSINASYQDSGTKSKEDANKSLEFAEKNDESGPPISRTQTSISSKQNLVIKMNMSSNKTSKKTKNPVSITQKIIPPHAKVTSFQAILSRSNTNIKKTNDALGAIKESKEPSLEEEHSETEIEDDEDEIRTPTERSNESQDETQPQRPESLIIGQTIQVQNQKSPLLETRVASPDKNKQLTMAQTQVIRKNFDQDDFYETKIGGLPKFASANLSERWPGMDARRLSDSEEDDSDHNLSPIDIELDIFSPNQRSRINDSPHLQQLDFNTPNTNKADRGVTNFEDLDQICDSIERNNSFDNYAATQRQRSNTSAIKKLERSMWCEAELKKAKDLDERLEYLNPDINLKSLISTSSKTHSSLMKKSQSDKNIYATSTKIWRPMSSIGEFIVLLLANTFLTHDYEGCLRIGSYNYAVLANSLLFQGNLSRFLALSSFKAFEHTIYADESLFEENFCLLYQALQRSKEALDIYEAKEGMSNIDQNLYGMALSNFTLAYIYENFADYFFDERVRNKQEYEDFMLGTLHNYQSHAQDYYKEAFTLFQQVNHLVGTYLSKKGVRRTFIEGDDDEDEHKEKMSLELEIVEERGKLIEYEQKYGLENNNCYILREHGEEISLMADIVWSKKPQAFFPESTHRKKKPIGRSETQNNDMMLNGLKFEPTKEPSYNLEDSAVNSSNIQTRSLMSDISTQKVIDDLNRADSKFKSD